MNEMSLYYKNVKRITRNGLLLYFGLIVLLMIVFSLFLGGPFVKTETLLFFTYHTEGWFFTKTYLIFLIILISILAAVSYGGIAGAGNVKQLQNILYQDCDAEKFHQILEEGIHYIPYELYKKQEQAEHVAKRELACLEMLYVEALLACGREEQAVHYLKEEWTSKRSALGYRQLSLSMEASAAYCEGDVMRYRSILEKGGRLLRRNVIIAARLDWLEGRKEEAVSRLQTATTSIPYEQVMIWALLSDYLQELGRTEEARICEDSVIEHGGTLALRSKILERRTKEDPDSVLANFANL